MEEAGKAWYLVWLWALGPFLYGLCSPCSLFESHTAAGDKLHRVCVCVCVCVCVYIYIYIHIHTCCCLVAKSCPALCDPMDCSLPGSLCPLDFPGKNTRVVAISFSKGSSEPRDKNHISCIGRQILYHWVTREALIYAYRFLFIILGFPSVFD